MRYKNNVSLNFILTGQGVILSFTRTYIIKWKQAYTNPVTNQEYNILGTPYLIWRLPGSIFILVKIPKREKKHDFFLSGSDIYVGHDAAALGFAEDYENFAMDNLRQRRTLRQASL